MPILSPRTGSVFVRDFDEGVVKRLGGYVGSFDLLNLGMRCGYWADLTVGDVTRVPIIFNEPEQIYERKVLPTFLITRDPPTPALQRWHSVQQVEYFAGVVGTETTEQVGNQTVSGFSQIEAKVQAWPYDISYTVAAYARYEKDGIAMLRHILRRFQPYGRIQITDDRQELRNYTTFHDGGVQDFSELVDVADRVKAYGQVIRVECELDLNDPVILGTVGTFASNLEVL